MSTDELSQQASDPGVRHAPKPARNDELQIKTKKKSRGLLNNSKTDKNGITKREPRMTEKEKQENRKILKDMQRKLNFLRNPRYRSNKNCLLYENKEFKEVVHKDNPFAVNPPIIIFRDYIIGKVYEIQLQLVNKTQLLKNFKYIPPVTPTFTVKGIQYPKRDSSLIAPGMCAKVDILFMPGSLENFNDFLTIITEFYAFKIPIKAIRDAPALSIESPMKCGQTLVGSQVTMNFLCKNNGGDAHFIFEIPNNDLVNPAYSINNHLIDEDYNDNFHDETLSFGPFYIFPRQFFLHKGKSIEVLVNFNPFKEGIEMRNLNILIDSKFSIPHQVSGEGILLDLRISEFDGSIINEEADMLEEILFDPTFPKGIQKKSFKIKNYSVIDAKYHWSFYDFFEENNFKLNDIQHFFEIVPSEGVIQGNSEVEFSVSFSPKHAKLYEKKLDFIIEDIPFQCIKKFNPQYSPENNYMMINQKNIMDVRNYSDPFILGHNSPFPYYPLFTFNIKGVGKLLTLSTPNSWVNFGDIFIGKKYEKEIKVLNEVSGSILFKMKRLFQMRKKQTQIHDYFRLFKSKPTSSILFSDYYNDNNEVLPKDKLEDTDRPELKEVKKTKMMFEGANGGKEKVIDFPNMMELILLYADDKFKSFESDYNNCNELTITTNSGFYNIKIDFATTKKVKLLKKEEAKKTSKFRHKEKLLSLDKQSIDYENTMTQRQDTSNNEFMIIRDLKSNNNARLEHLKIEKEKHAESENYSEINSRRSFYEGKKQRKVSTTGLIGNSNTRLTGLIQEEDRVVSEHMIFVADVENKEGTNFNLNFTPTQLGPFKGTIIFIAQDCQPLSFDIQANVKGPAIKVNKPAIVFPLSSVSKIQSETFSIENLTEIEAVVIIKESRYKGIGFSNIEEYAMTSKGIITSVEEKPKMQTLLDLKMSNMKREEHKKEDAYKIMFTDVHIVLQPFQKKEITVTFTSPYPIILKELIQISVFNGDSTFLRLEGNLQTSNCYIDETIIQPENIFISTPIIYKANSFKMINPSNLPVSFKWTNKNNKDGTQAFFMPNEGIIRPESEITIKYDITFHAMGDIDELFYCTVPEIDLPLGVVVLGQVRGLNISYELTDETAAGLAAMRDNITCLTTYSNKSMKSRFNRSTSGAVHFDKTLHSLFYKMGVNNCKKQSFLIRNNSGITTTFSISMKNYSPVTSIQHNLIGLHSDLASQLSSGTSQELLSMTSKTGSTGRMSIRGKKTNLEKISTRPLLSNKHEEMNFTSEKGLEHSLNKKVEKESELYLSNKKGIAVVVNPCYGSLEPYSEAIVEVSVYNESVGDFEDELNCSVKGLGIASFPVKIQVRGNPIKLYPFQPGIDYDSEIPVIKVGSVLTKAGQIDKVFKISNSGNNKITIKWKVYDYDDILEPKRDIINLAIKEKGNHYEFSLTPVEPIQLRNRFYQITPITGELSPKGCAEFKLSFITDRVGLKSALILAELIFDDKKMTNVKMSDLAIRVDAWGVQPKLTVDKNPNIEGSIIYKFIQHSSVLNKQDYAYLCKSNFVNNFSSSINNTKHKRSVILMNKEKIEFKIKLEIEGPFEITGISPKESILGNHIFLIMPGTNIKVDVKFKAPSVTNEAEWPMLLMIEKYGQITVRFENAEMQVYHLKAILKRPRIFISTTGNESVEGDNRIDFGHVNVESYAESKLHIMNETEVSTSWEIKYVKYTKKTNYGYATMVDDERDDVEMTDDSEVFTFNKTEGLIHGPSNMLISMPLGPGLPKRDDYKIEELAPVAVKILFKVKYFYYAHVAQKKRSI